MKGRLSLMLSTAKESLSFLEWLKNTCNKEGKLPKIEVMPLRLFEDYVKRYCKEYSMDKEVGDRIIESVKEGDSALYMRDSESCGISIKQRNERNFKFVTDRYLSNESTYKCLILPLEAEYEIFKELVTRCWNDLDGLSADYLDIYYVFENYCYNGYQLMREFRALGDRFHTDVPCIVIWKNSIEKAEAVSIEELSVIDVFKVIREIVSLIRNDKSLLKITEGANAKAQQMRDMRRPIVNNYIQNVSGSSNVHQIVNNGDNNVVVENGNYVERFVSEVDKAIKFVDEESELTVFQKSELKAILDEAKEGVKENSQEKIASSRNRFKTFRRIVGNGAITIINVLAGLATIAEFFGLSKIN